jgi:uncharacterized protein YcnI
MNIHKFTAASAALAGLLATGLAAAHVVLEVPNALAGSSYRATFRVGHGCEGSATTGITVQLPAGFAGAKPMPKPGWTLSTTLAKLDTPYVSHGKTVVEDVTTVSWTANGPEYALPDAWYDEFVLRGGLPAKAGPLWFKVLQTCEKGRNDWLQIPATGIFTTGLKAPAVLLEVVEAAPAAHQH